MKATTKTLTLAVLGAGLIAGVIVLGMWLMGGSERAAQANAALVIVGFDMDPTNTPANSCPNDGTDCTLGTIETCVEVATGGGPVEFDVFLDDIPDTDSMLGFGYVLGEKTSTLLGPITACTHEDVNVNLIMQAEDSSTFGLNDPCNGSVTVPGYGANMADLGTAEYNPPFTQGTLGRYTLNTTGVADGLYGLTLGNVIVGNNWADDLCLIYGCDIWDANSLPQPYGLIAVGQACPAYADVEIVDQVVKAGNCTTDPPTTIDAGVATDLCLVKTIRNNGPTTPVDVSITTDLTAPADCTVTPDPLNPTSESDLTSTPVDVNEVFTIECAEPSNHSLSFENEIAITTPDVIDTDETNNSMTTPYDIGVLVEADVSLTQQVLASDCSSAPPTELPQGADVDVCVQKTIHSAGPYAGDVDVSITDGATPPGTCTANFVSGPATATVNTSGDTVVDEIWRLNCPDTGTGLEFIFDNVIGVMTAHVTDPNLLNDEDVTGLTVDVTASADARILSWVFPDALPAVGNEVLVVPDVAQDMDTTETLDIASGTYAGASVDVDITITETPGANCTATPDVGNWTSATLPMDGTPVVDYPAWSVTLSSPATFCTIDFDKEITITTVGVNDSNPANNTAAVTVTLVADTDGDTVPDDYSGLTDLCPGTAPADPVDANGCSDAQVDGDGDGICDPGAPSGGPSGCTGSDNCPDVYNPDQADLDGDGVGDACDPDIDGDTVLNENDNCPLIENPGQENADSDGIGDVCELDVDCSGGEADILDAVAILQYILGRADPSTECPPPSGHINAPRASAYVAYDPGEPELVGTIFDAVMILQCILGRHNIVCPASP